MNQIEFRIIHDGNNWVIENNLLAISSSTLEELDIKLKALLKEKGVVKKGERVKVLMMFDNSTIPRWIRQYAQHYFDRIVEVEG